MKSDGHDGIDAMLAAVQERFPGHRFRRLGEVDTHNDRIRFAWELTPGDGDAIASGTDFGVLANARPQPSPGFSNPFRTAPWRRTCPGAGRPRPRPTAPKIFPAR